MFCQRLIDRRDIWEDDMQRRSFLGGLATGSVAASATALATPAIAQNTQTWRMVTAWPKNFPGQGVGAQRLADRITQASGGRLTIQVFSAGELVPPLQSLDAVIDGNAEMSHGASYYWQNKSAGLSLFSGVPYGMTSRELSAWIRHMGGQQLWDDIYDQFGVQGFLAGDTGTQAGGWFRNELTSVADIQGLRFRTPGLGGTVWQQLGASVTNMAAGEIFQALQSGTLDAAEFVGPYNDLALGFHQIAKNYYFPSFIEPALTAELAIDKSKYLALPEDLQAIIRLAAQAEHDEIASDFAANDPRALETLIDDHGVQVRQFPEDILEAGAKAAAEAINSLRDGDELTARAVEGFIAALAIVRRKTELAETPFVRAREQYFKL
ncbi:MAG: TRAP transporter substrate-binding protein [Aliihoeflea sp.]|uniref:TRAP transporter substrate-binding protein n=1 Tax=Aliihoeflea sp. TaxID=2608088 RepID=UPI0040333E25